MKRQFKVEGTVVLRDGSIVLTGSVDGDGWEKGPLLDVGQYGLAVMNGGEIKVEIIGATGFHRESMKPGMEMVLVRVLGGDSQLLKGATVNFD